MKKYFLFAAVAGMLASCSSESLTGSDPKIEPTQEDRVPIEIGVATAQTKAITRGVGTVGDKEGGTNNWQGEKVKVFMFVKGSLTPATSNGEAVSVTNPALYDNTELTTPNATNTGIAKEIYNEGSGDRVRYKYYPASGNFDFWGYYADDAVTGAVTNDGSEVKVPFSIDGTQDLMVAKADTTTAQKAIIDDDDVFGTDKNRYYSAFAARKNIQPDMTFNHLLTRLTFSVLAGNDETRGYTAAGPALPADGQTYTGVFIKSIKVRSLKAGNIIAAYTGSDRALTDLISFTKSATPAAADSLLMDLPGARTGATLPPLYDPAIFEIAGTPAPWTSEYLAAKKLLVIDRGDDGPNAHWSEIWRPQTLVATPPATNPVGDQIGGAVIVAPDSKYYIEVVLGQYLLDNDNLTGTDPKFKVVYTTFKKEITPTTGTAFAQGTSYNVKIILYGFERIDITTTLQAWNDGGDVEIIAE